MRTVKAYYLLKIYCLTLICALVVLGLIIKNDTQFDPAAVRGTVEYIAALLMLCGLSFFIWHRFKKDLGITTISVQFLSLIFVFPTILILSLEKILSGEVAGTLIGTLAGYFFAEFGRGKTPQTNVPSKKNEKNDQLTH